MDLSSGFAFTTITFKTSLDAHWLLGSTETMTKFSFMFFLIELVTTHQEWKSPEQTNNDVNQWCKTPWNWVNDFQYYKYHLPCWMKIFNPIPMAPQVSQILCCVALLSDPK